MADEAQTHKRHSKKRAGSSRTRVVGKGHTQKGSAAGRLRAAALAQNRLQAPIPDRTLGLDGPGAPLVVAIAGPPGSGKSTLLRSLVRRYTRQGDDEAASSVLGGADGLRGPVTVVAGKDTRYTFVECAGRDLATMVDVSKIADVVVLLVDARAGLTLDAFEMLHLLQTHGLPRVQCVLTHVDDGLRVSGAAQTCGRFRALRKTLERRLATEIAPGARLLALCGLQYGRRYLDRDVAVLAFPTPPNPATLADLDEKSLVYRAPFSSQPNVKPRIEAPADFPEDPPGAVIPLEKVMDLTDRLRPDGTLDWEIPPGKWTVLRFVSRNNGASTRPAPEPGIGFEDHLEASSPESLCHVGCIVDRILQRGGVAVCSIPDHQGHPGFCLKSHEAQKA